jgi:hypothetical protein
LVGGGERHRYAILLAAEVAAAKGYRVADMTIWGRGSHRPDLVISRREKFQDGARRTHRTLTYWLEIVDTHDPDRKWIKPPCDDILKIRIADKTLDEVVDELKRVIP